MSVLHLSTPIRMRSTAQPLETPDVEAAPVRMLEWSSIRDGQWTARIGLDSAGCVERTAAGFEAVDWQGEHDGVFATLAEAQLSLEPAVRAERRDRLEAEERRGSMLSSMTMLAGAAAAATAIVGWIVVLPL